MQQKQEGEKGSRFPGRLPRGGRKLKSERVQLRVAVPTGERKRVEVATGGIAIDSVTVYLRKVGGEILEVPGLLTRVEEEGA